MDKSSCRVGMGLCTHHAAKDCSARRLTGQLAKEFLFVKAVFECLATINEDDRHFIGELAPQLVVTIDVNLSPGKSAAPMQLGQRFFDDLTQVTAFAGVDNHLAALRHGKSVAMQRSKFHEEEGRSSGSFVDI